MQNKENLNQGIPKMIHYCWFGHGEKSDLIKKCIQSWKINFPGWNIIEWNEDTFDINSIDYVKEAYENRKWAFVSDYVRFFALYKYGGIYFDTDVEVLKPIPTTILEKDSFTGMEFTGKVAPGLIYAAKPEDINIKNFLKMYENMHFLNKDGTENLKTINIIVSKYFMRKGLIFNNTIQTVNGCTIYPWQYFCGYDTDIHEVQITDQTISVHHYDGSWRKHKNKDTIIEILKKLLGIKRYRNILKLKRKILKRDYLNEVYRDGD